MSDTMHTQSSYIYLNTNKDMYNHPPTIEVHGAYLWTEERPAYLRALWPISNHWSGMFTQTHAKLH